MLPSTMGRGMGGVVATAVTALALVLVLVLGVTIGSAAAAVAGGAPPPRPGADRLAARAAGRPLSLHLVVGTETDDATGGYWVVASNGGVFSFDAPFDGSAGALPLVRPIVGMAATPDGGGYWLVASDGGIFSFGDAPFFGSMGGRPLDRPIVGMAATPGWRRVLAGRLRRRHLRLRRRRLPRLDGWAAAQPSHRGHGRHAGRRRVLAGRRRRRCLRLRRRRVLRFDRGPHPPRPGGGHGRRDRRGGYWLVAADGGVFAFGAPFAGSAAGTLRRAGCGGVVDAGRRGYRVVSADGSRLRFRRRPPPRLGRRAPAGRRDGAPSIPGTTAAMPGPPASSTQPIDGGGLHRVVRHGGHPDGVGLFGARLQLRRGHPAGSPAGRRRGPPW